MLSAISFPSKLVRFFFPICCIIFPPISFISQYLQIARKLPSYGSIKFSNATADYPRANSLVNILIGNKELLIQTTTNDGKCQETKFKITRMRCWRVTTNYNVSSFVLHSLSHTLLPLSIQILMQIWKIKFTAIGHLFRMKIPHHIRRRMVAVTVAVAHYAQRWSCLLNI